jgi:hypothetical protein
MRVFMMMIMLMQMLLATVVKMRMAVFPFLNQAS